ncbi:hypothetical protein [Caloranaerobacter azorensis]|uniref:Phage portal protein n=1 Tax=Caloranaerobacter azorensis TaxID=116090 RepID=A0A6P1Y9T7_9FIRM|nr:hypothetical protein [Caloranaerobacter azorensis]QIB26099.1 hypothetical protein G3A45_01505 [Caloranaerobacter azorensis]
MIEREIGSIAKYMYDVSGIKNIYFDEVPQDFKKPSLYFPTPMQIQRGDTVNSYAYMNSLFVKVFDEKTRDAYSKAATIVNSISKNRNLIPLVKEDGAQDNKGIRLRKVSIKKLDVGTIQIEVQWDSVFAYTEETYAKVQRFYFDMKEKEGK